MKLLEERIKRDGRIKPGNVLKVDNFLNHMMDIELLNEMGKELYRLFKDSGAEKILTIEASGIGFACLTAQYFGIPVVYAKKTGASNISDEVYSTQVYSYTHNKINNVAVAKEYLGEGEKILIIDDFLAVGSALNGLINICGQAGAQVVGCGIAVEKGYQGGGDKLRASGMRVESLAIVESMDEEKGFTFREQ